MTLDQCRSAVDDARLCSHRTESEGPVLQAGVGKALEGNRSLGMLSPCRGDKGVAHQGAKLRGSKCVNCMILKDSIPTLSDITPESPSQVTTSVQGPGLPHRESPVSSRVEAPGLTVQHGSHWPLVATEHLNCGWSRRRCTLSVIKGLP